MPRLTDLTAATTPLDGTEVLYVVQGGNSRRTVTQEVADLVPLASGRNLIINGSGRINQRGYVSGTATTGANQFTLDRWFVVTSGQNLSFTGNDSARVMTAPAGGVSQVIEGANIVGGTYVLNWTGTATATVGGVARTKGEAFTLTANTNVTVTFTSGTFSEVQLEAGSVVTPFERRSVGQELALCQRYYEQIGARFRFDAALGTSIIGVSQTVFYSVQKLSGAVTSILSQSGTEASAINDIAFIGRTSLVVTWSWTNAGPVTRTKNFEIAISSELTA